MFDIRHYLEQQRQRVDASLDDLLPPASIRPATLHEAMRYSLFAGGKRLRPILCLAAAEAVQPTKAVDPRIPGALEILHTYTLIHDDLPAMDDDDLRRGRPTCHKVYGEAVAILAGDALLTLAMEWLAGCIAPPPYHPGQYGIELARAAGSVGVIGGQAADIAAEGQPPDPETLEFIHRNKTGELIRAAVRMGAIAAEATPPQLDALSRFGEAAGLAFQIADDLLNETSTAEQLGKAVGSDRARGKMTYVALLGIEGAGQRARELLDRALSSLDGLPGHTEPLRALARVCVEREN